MRVFIWAVVVLVAALAQACLADAEAPGRVGVYLKLTAVGDDSEALREEMRRIRAAGVDFIVPLAKDTSGRVYWDSRIAPRELVASRTYMSRITRLAHLEGLKVYPWICVCTEGGLNSLNALLEEHPDWASVTADGKIGFVDPGNPDARAYEAALIEELVQKVNVDGVSLDYVRASNRYAYTPTLRSHLLKEHGVDARDILALGSGPVGTEAGKVQGEGSKTSPREHPLWPEWREWFRGQLNLLMEEIEQRARRGRPGITIGSYVWGAHTYGESYQTYQDWKGWIGEGWLDWINPSGYRYTDEAFVEAARLNRQNVPAKCPMLITIGVRTSHGSLTPAEVKRHMSLARQEGADGVIFFTWEALEPFLAEVGDDIRAWSADRKP